MPTAERFAVATQALIDDPNCDGVSAILTPQAMSHPTATAQALIKVARTHQLKPLLTSFMGEIKVAEAIKLFHAARVPTFNTPEDAVGAYMYMYQYARNLANLYETPGDILPQFEPTAPRSRRRFWPSRAMAVSVLTEPEGQTIIQAYQIPVVRTLVATSPEECAAAAEEVGLPVAVKS